MANAQDQEESLTVGLLTHQPDDHLAYLQQCLTKARDKSSAAKTADSILAELVRADVTSSAPKLLITQPLPPIQSSRGDSAAESQTSHTTADLQAHDRNAQIQGLRRAPLPPIQPREKADGIPLQKKADDGFLLDPKIVFVLGGPGSGKGTQCARIVQCFGFVHLSAGDLLRNLLLSGSSEAKEVEATMAEGGLVPNELIIQLLKQAMMEAQQASEHIPGFLIDGFPRELDQGIQFEKEAATCSMALAFEAPEQVLVERLLLRGRMSARLDDNEETIRKRLMTFSEKTRPVFHHYDKQGKLYRIDAVPSAEVIFERVREILSSAGFTTNPDRLATAKVVFVLGGPGSGKGTQCEQIVKEYGFVHLSTGDLLREELKSGSERAGEISLLMAEGKLVPKEMVVDLLVGAMKKAGKVPGFLVDGFPRELDQAVLFESQVVPSCLVLSFDAADKVLVERLLHRAKTSGRVDDNEETIRKRLATFKEKTVPVLRHFAEMGKLEEINANQSIDEIFRAVKRTLDAAGFSPRSTQR